MNRDAVLSHHPTAASVAAAAAVCAIAAGSLVAATAVLVVVTGLADDARSALGFGFGGVDRSIAEAARIVIHNGKFAGGTLLCAAMAPLIPKWALLITDAALATLLALNAGAVEIAFSAYGQRAIAATAPHLPLELAGLSLVGGAYVQARRQPFSPQAIGAVAGACGVLLTIASLSKATSRWEAFDESFSPEAAVGDSVVLAADARRAVALRRDAGLGAYVATDRDGASDRMAGRETRRQLARDQCRMQANALSAPMGRSATSCK